ncbi:MAG: cold-shock protein, partial [Tannerellaceae bacterium]
MLIGLVKWFDTEKGFGIIRTPDGEEYFLHVNSFV